MKILTVDQMRQAEQAAARAGLPTSMLMENAGKAVAEATKHILSTMVGQHVLVLVGPGNNGGDGLVAARYFHDLDTPVSLYLCAQRPANDPNLGLIRQRDITCIEAKQDDNFDQLDKLLLSATVVIDAIFGTGQSRPLGDFFVKILDKVRQAKEQRPSLRLIALDLPSGLNADTGAVDPACLYVDNTITLGFPKPGLFNFPGAERAGKITVVDIGIPAALAATATTELMTDGWVKSVLPRRPLSANKGTFGRVLVVAGSINYIGAAYLACSGASRAGAGLVTLATASSLLPVLASKLTEVTYLPLSESRHGIISPEATKVVSHELSDTDVLLIGCGLGQSRPVARFIESTIFELKPDRRLVIDADALNALAKIPQWWQQLPDDAILTPHPGEMSRLTGLSVGEIQSDRMGVARRVAREWHKTIVLKGAYTMVAGPGGQVRVSPFVNAGLASAGTGDVLSGVIAGLLAQGLSFFDAAAGGVYLHGEAGELVKDKLGDTGMLASDLLPELPVAVKQIKER
ncbi:MAG: NAD(P)H-hydrate dehydratase [Chloroflexota bacterium]